MAFLDKIIGAATPPESDEHRLRVRAETRVETVPGDWLSLILDHHDAIEQAFEAVRIADDAHTRRAAQRRLAVLLTGHSIAEEAVLYPEMADSGHKSHAGVAYEEQSMAKVQLALLDKIEPMSQDYLDKLEHLRGAVTHHMFQEESNWFLDLKAQVPAERQALLAARYREEVERYIGSEHV
ncbi:hemerythrin domain-containing protein [Sphingomonas morindae]|uniref:Hemerythrin domain-containing protein n=1 Tax=Sphingomonas morindae TaxID=1541170 RepID=A0ABY4XDA7_9SPHN|nr:hemerythrin domain-containing protein [Sphingomonas morindae]USI74956.1 hemerythrin domain-containing protein [Sphingomonas morindae]